ncbi:MAG: FAD-dependent oxidoreductase [Saccharospirillaceae bacterium]|nr:FAD-dependent oxidoreductase [Saccharospirillaceae bacterium]MCD8532686.1 FAD-dependent oxidoreductase [Saccharospirillaceae bacterium]
MAHIAIIGAGMAGLSALQHLADQGHEVTVFDKSRGSGGRMASKRVDNASWDMGAQFIRAHSAAFTAQLQQWQRYGWIGEWNITPWTASASGLNPSPDNVQRYVGMPRMTGLSRSLLEPAAAFIASTRIVSASHEASSGQWLLNSDNGNTFGPFDGLLINTPPQQAIPLLTANPKLAAQCEQVDMLPCWTLLLTLPEAISRAPDAVFVKQGAISWIARNSSKPGRDDQENGQENGKETWVIQADHHWSSQCIDAPHEQVQQALLSAFFATLQQPPQQPDTLWLHRWLYAIPANSLTLGALSDIGQHLVVCGDWCHSPSLEGAWLSGQQAARTLLTTLPTRAEESL